MSTNYDGSIMTLLSSKRKEMKPAQSICTHTKSSGGWFLNFTGNQAVCRRCGYVFARDDIDDIQNMSFNSVIRTLQLAKLDACPDDIRLLGRMIRQLETIKQHRIGEDIIRRGRPSRLYVRDIRNTALLNAADSLMGRDKKHSRTSAIVAIIIATLRKNVSIYRYICIDISSITIRDIAYGICDEFTDWVIPDTNSK